MFGRSNFNKNMKLFLNLFVGPIFRPIRQLRRILISSKVKIFNGNLRRKCLLNEKENPQLELTLKHIILNIFNLI